MIEKKTVLNEETADIISGGVAAPGAAMICTAATPLYASNPAGDHFRSTVNTTGTVQPGSVVKLFEYGAKYCKIISDGKVGWIETAFLTNK